MAWTTFGTLGAIEILGLGGRFAAIAIALRRQSRIRPSR